MQEYSIYEHKYNKYKNKYLKLRKINQFGGGSFIFSIDTINSKIYLPQDPKNPKKLTNDDVSKKWKEWETTIWKPLSDKYPDDYNYGNYSIMLQPQKIYFGRPPISKGEEEKIKQLKDGKYIPLPVSENGEPFYISFRHFFVEFDTTEKKYRITTEKERPNNKWTVLLQRNEGEKNFLNPKSVTLEVGDIIKIGGDNPLIHLTVKFTYLN